MKLNKINWRHKKYIFPLIMLPLLLFGNYQYGQFQAQKQERLAQKEQQTNEINTALGTVQDTILTKNDAYNTYKKRGDMFGSMVGEIKKDDDSLGGYTDAYDDETKRKMDSLIEDSKAKKRMAELRRSAASSYAGGNLSDEDRSNSPEIRKQQELVDLLQNQREQQQSQQRQNQYTNENQEEEQDPVQMMRKQMLFLDSLEKSKDPKYQADLAAQKRMKLNEEEWQKFLSTTLTVSKTSSSPYFNTIGENDSNPYVKAIIDESTKGYLGTRIRIRLLEDVYVGEKRIPKGTLLYSLISGFKDQRVLLHVVSIFQKGELLPVNLSIYDMDGMEGLYVPNSQFKEMIREMGTTTVQGNNLNTSQQSFYSSLFSNVFQSTSNSLASLIRKNKAKVKYNTYIYLINKKERQNGNF